MIYFYKESISKNKKKLRAWERMVWVSDFFYKESKSKKKEKNIFLFSVFDIFFLKGGGGVGMEGVVSRGGRVARVSEFFLQIIQT